MKVYKLLSILLLSFVIISCNKNKTNEEEEVADDTVQYEYYLQGNIDGVDFESGIEVGATSNFDPYGTAMSYQPVFNGAACVDMIYEPGLYPFGNKSLGSLNIGFQLFLGELGLTCPEEIANFESIFSNGSYSFAASESDYGVTIGYALTSDGTSDYYISYGAQDNAATFQITDVSEEQIELNKKYVVVTGIFNCRIYNDSDPNDSVDILNGKFKVPILSYNSL